METIEVFADPACPFAHVGLARFCAVRRQRGLEEPRLRVRAWPLELVNDQAHDGAALAPKVAALRSEVAPDRFEGFDPTNFPATSRPALAAEAAAHRTGPEIGEAFSLAIREALFDDGLDVSAASVLDELCGRLGVPAATAEDHEQVELDLAEGRQRGVQGSPYFLTTSGGFFCPSLDIEHAGAGYLVTFDQQAYEAFLETVLPTHAGSHTPPGS